MDIEATVTFTIKHHSGPVIRDPSHIVSWIVADGQRFDQRGAGIEFQVCPHHPQSDDCDCDSDDVAIYVATPVMVDIP
jgi:hypothetical protein